MESNIYGMEQERMGHHEQEHEEMYDDEKGTDYERYIKEFNTNLTKVMLRHGFGRFPSVDVYQLLDVPGPNYKFSGNGKDLTHVKFLVYYGDEDADDLDVLIPVYRDRALLGVGLQRMLEELHVRYDDHRTLNDVINDLFESLFRDPNDEIPHGVSNWVRSAYSAGRTIGSLKQGGEWGDIAVGIRAQKLGLGQPGDPAVKVMQINYQNLMVEVTSPIAGTDRVDLMMLLNA